MDIGGGLVSNKFASNRHEEARNDFGKKTKGEVVQIFKRATNLDSIFLNNLIDYIYPNLEWHHAGKLPKSYGGGGMKKTYFLNSKQIYDLADNFNLHLDNYNSFLENKKIEFENYRDKENKKLNFALKNAIIIERLQKSKIENLSLFVETNRECNGKFGWFSAAKNIYNMEEYYTGYQFKNEKDLNKYLLIG